MMEQDLTTTVPFLFAFIAAVYQRRSDRSRRGLISGQSNNERVRLSHSALPFQSESEEEDRPEDLPPVGDCPHLGEGDAVGLRVFDGDRYLDDSVMKPERLEQQIRFKLVPVEPILPEIDSLVVEQRKLDCSKAARRVGHPAPAEQREEKRVSPSAQPPTKRHSQKFAAFQIARTLREFCFAIEDRLEQTRYLFGRSLAAARDYYDNLVTVLDCEIDPTANGRAHSAIHTRANDRGPRPLSVIGGCISRAVIHDDSRFDRVGGNGFDYSRDALAFVPCRRDAENARPGFDAHSQIARFADEGPARFRVYFEVSFSH